MLLTLQTFRIWKLRKALYLKQCTLSEIWRSDVTNVAFAGSITADTVRHCCETVRIFTAGGIINLPLCTSCCVFSIVSRLKWKQNPNVEIAIELFQRCSLILSWFNLAELANQISAYLTSKID